MNDVTKDTTGLGTEPQDSWPDKVKLTDKRPIEMLAPNTKLHTDVLSFLMKRLNKSERKMREFYPRWQINEKRVQAYIDLPKYEKMLKESNESGAPAKVVSITVPYTFATVSTIVTYMAHIFTGRRPMFQISTYKKETVQGARMMELVMQYNADHTRLVKQYLQFFNDCEIYGLGIMRTKWETKKGMRTVWKSQPKQGFLGMFGGNETVRSREERTIYSGNAVETVDPFLFFPDTDVPFHETNRKGEFCFWREFLGKHKLMLEEQAGKVKWIKEIPASAPAQDSGSQTRDDLRGGTNHDATKSKLQIDQGTCWIIPRELGIGESEVPELWLFAIANKGQIIQAEPFTADHGMHPVSVAEPHVMGYGLGNYGMTDYLSPMQDTLSWLINSHMDNVKSAMNNLLVVDPSMVEMQDLKNPGPGGLIRLKKAMMGRDVRSAINQLQVHDVTTNHVKDFEVFMRMGDTLSAISDNLRGVQAAGGRKTATEVRQSGEAAASRLAKQAKVISSHAIVDLAEQMSINIQQYLEDEFYISIVGEQGMEQSIHSKDIPIDAQGGVNIAPEMLAGDFYYPVHDGTLPIDKVAMLDVWKEVFMMIASDPELRSQFSVPKIFEHLAELGGAKNIEQFKLDLNVAQPGTDLQGQAQAGNALPIGVPQQ